RGVLFSDPQGSGRKEVREPLGPKRGAGRHLARSGAPATIGRPEGKRVSCRLRGRDGRALVEMRRRSASGLDELFGPGNRLEDFDPKAEKRRVGGDGDGEIAVFGGPPLVTNAERLRGCGRTTPGGLLRRRNATAPVWSPSNADAGTGPSRPPGRRCRKPGGA